MENFDVKPVEGVRVSNGDKTVDLFVFSTDADDIIVKIATDNRVLGIGAEYTFIRHKFPDYKVIEQSLKQIIINGTTVFCDELVIRNETDEKKVFFDISDFFESD